MDFVVQPQLWQRWGKTALKILALLGLTVGLGWGMLNWSQHQLRLEPPVLSPLATASPTPSPTPGWWESPLAIPTWASPSGE